MGWRGGVRRLAVVLVAVPSFAFQPCLAAAPEDCGFSFSEVAAETGLRFQHDAGAAGGLHLPETMGAGVAWIDFDGDGWLDLYLVQSGPFPPDGGAAAADRLFRNLGPDQAGEFRFVPAGAGDLASGYGQGVVAADVDGDRDVDLLVSHYGPTVLLRNDGAGRFEAAEALSPAGEDEHPWGSSMALADADGDGDLDLYVGRYLDYDPGHGLDCRRDGPDSPSEVCDPSLFPGQLDRYYENRGDGSFEDTTDAAGLGGADGKGLGVLFTDLDGDGWPDVYVANDLTLNLLFRNLGDGGFEDLSLLSGTAVNRSGRPEAGMGLAAADFDVDGDPDLTVTNFDVETNTLYRNAGPASGMLFEDVSATTGFGQPSFNLLGFGIVAGDLDRDGALDVYVANGHIFASPRRDNTEHRQRNLLLRGLAGDGRGRFVEARCAWVEEEPLVSRGTAAADFDNDGDVDLAVTANDGPARLWRNDTAGSTTAAWLGLELRGRSPNTQAVGAVATLSAESGPPPARRWIVRGDSYQSSSGHRLRWAVPADGGPLRLDLRWPSGARTRIVDPPPGVYLVVEAPP
ncbi:MAG: CRTAC1 family protein [Holophagales bacterium]|nr:CRTAC1 family protein [Holophagales bacterium]MYD24024.1 CRTAC1 family protein [Holophagales bacterium]MYI32947.1 CRTAC1 family protein [Holophagales bacterium]